ncbi:MAG: TonB-dependent receptor [Bacteroidales bacterium]|nr:TonB-dependent receptor [Bacteroidales bacterium]
MKKYQRVIIAVLGALVMAPQISTGKNYREEKDTVSVLSEVAVVAKMKQKNNLREEPLSSTTIKLGDIERRQIVSLSDAAQQVPNLHIPVYGSRMTSSIYVRGLGSRIDHPAVGMYVDNVPYLNKNGFDSQLWDIMRIEILRGPQSTLYGRNTIGGIMNVYTLSPQLYQGTRLSAGYSSGNTWNAKGSVYVKPSNKFAFSIGGNYRNSDGFFTNATTGENVDWEESLNGRVRLVFTPNSRFTIDNSFMAGKVDQGGYAYRLYNAEDGSIAPVSYNDPCGYVRTTISDGLSLSYNAGSHIFSSVTTWQYLDDCMTLDQDFTSASMFTMQQAQRENTVTQDFTVKTADGGKKWQWLTGLTLFFKDMEMDAPVTFRQDGINGLILGNINGMFQGMPAPMNTAKLKFAQDEFLLSSKFDLPVFGAAMYHQSQFNLGKFTLTAGLRLDYERAGIDYMSNSAVDYIYSMKVQMGPMLREIKVESNVNTSMSDKLENEYLELLPKFTLQYSLEEKGNLYASVSRGFKAGGYNTQIFSDILQNRVKEDLMADLMEKAGGSLGSMGGSMGGAMGGSSSQSYTVDEIITYKPEYSWNFELGGHFTLMQGKLTADAAIFYIDCTDQQLTVFPNGNTTGRMMTNAGKTESFGVEMALNAQITGNLTAGISYGHTSAKFVNYNDGINDYKGKYVPYVPKNTLQANAAYTFYSLGNALDKLQLRVGYTGTGKIYWNESNTLEQDFYSLLGSSVYAEKGKFSLELWGKNLTDTNYNAFWFQSVGNGFFSQGMPAEFGVTFTLHF